MHDSFNDGRKQSADFGRCVCARCEADFMADCTQGQDVSKRVNERMREREREKRGGGSQAQDKGEEKRASHQRLKSAGPRPEASNLRKQREDLKQQMNSNPCRYTLNALKALL